MKTNQESEVRKERDLSKLSSLEKIIYLEMKERNKEKAENQMKKTMTIKDDFKLDKTYQDNMYAYIFMFWINLIKKFFDSYCYYLVIYIYENYQK